MNEFWIRAVSVVMITMALFGYNAVLESREKDEQIAELSLQLSGVLQTETGTISGNTYMDGTYTGQADGFGGEISVEIVIQEHQITEINVLSAEKEDGAYFSMAREIIPKIIEKQSAEVDTISGATFSSSGIREASAQALKKAVE